MWSAILSTYNYSNRLVMSSNYGSQYACTTYSLNKNLGPNRGALYLEHISVFVQHIINTYVIDVVVRIKMSTNTLYVTSQLRRVPILFT